MSGKEILTLQFGHYANFVGTHWWNIQELGFEYKPTSEPSEINHDVLYREGLTAKGEVTYTPRMLLVDLKGSLKTLPEAGSLYQPVLDPIHTDILWNENQVDIKQQETVQKNKFQVLLESGPGAVANCDIEEDVNVWSDYLYTRFHPRSVHVVKEYEHDSSNVPFDVFPLGTNLWQKEEFQEDFADNIRKYVEECDGFQGFQILTDSTNAFGGLSTACMQYLQDEYETKSIFAMPLIQSHYPDYNYDTDEQMQQSQLKDSIRVLNLALCYDSLRENSNLFVPLSLGSKGWRQPGEKREFNHTNYNHELPYHSSAILASALDTFTLKYRLKAEHFTLSDLSAGLTQHGRKATAASLCLPFSLNSGSDLMDCLDNWDGPLVKSISPNITIGSDNLLQMLTLRGIGESRLKKSIDKAGKQRDLPAYSCTSVNEMLSMYMNYSTSGCSTNVTNIARGLTVKRPFPNIFDDKVGIDGNITSTLRSPKESVESLPVLSGLHCGANIGEMIQSLHTEARRVKIARFHQFTSAGLEKDEFTECLDRLFDFRECYEDNYLI